MATQEAKVMKDFLKNQMAFSVVERGWYHGPDNIAIFSTEEEALSFLGITKEQNEAEKVTYHTGEYCYRVVEEINLAMCFDNILKMEREQECYKKVAEIEKEGNQRIYCKGYSEGYNEAQTEIKEAVKKFINDLPSWVL